LSPLALECPVCGLALSRPTLPRPFLFQASALAARASFEPLPGAPKAALTAPALGRVPTLAPEMEPIRLGPDPEPRPEAPPAAPLPALGAEAPTLSLGPLLLLESGEALILALLNGALALLVSGLVGVGLGRLYTGAWFLVLPLHFLASWAFLLVPLMLGGQSPLMGRLNLVLTEEAPERRLAYSLLHLLSLALLPLSVLCLILGRRHQTLAELLSGQEILPHPVARMR
jgi:hypothetical protein